MKRSEPFKSGFRGQPIMVLAVLLCAWSGVRYATWAAPFPAAEQSAVANGAAEAGAEAATEAARADNLQALVASATRLEPSLSQASDRQADLAVPHSFGDPSGWQAPQLPAGSAAPDRSDPASRLSAEQASDTDIAGEQVSGAFAPVPPRMAAGHAMLMAAGFSQMEVPPQIAAFFNPATGPAARARPSLASVALASVVASANGGQAAPYPVAAAPSDQRRIGRAQSRWSADGWLLWREDNSSPLLSGRPSYGRSQMGAVVRYNLAPSSGRAPQVHLRGSSTLAGSREREVAAGVSARPLAVIPLRLAVEMRASDRAEGRELRPAAYAVTELAPQQLPMGLQAEAYVQGGYVGGEFATAFVDGQARVDGVLVSAGDFDLRAGGGVWGGAQEGAARVDVGPSAALTFSMGSGRGRLAADYRIRVTGDAEPSSGPALTLSAGF